MGHEIPANVSWEALGYMATGADHRPLAIESRGCVVGWLVVDVAGAVEDAAVTMTLEKSAMAQNDGVGHDRATVTAVGRSIPSGVDHLVPFHMAISPELTVATQYEGDGHERFVAPFSLNDGSADQRVPFQRSALPDGSSAAHHESEAHDTIGLTPELGEPT